MLFAFEHGENGDLFIKKAPACTIKTQAEAVCELFGGKKEEIKVIGIRHGEKMYETLLTNEECAKAIDMGDFYRVPADNRGLNYDKFFKEGDEKRNTLTGVQLQQHAPFGSSGDRSCHRIPELHTEPTCRGKIRSMEGHSSFPLSLFVENIMKHNFTWKNERRLKIMVVCGHAAGDHPAGCGDEALPGVF